MTLVRRIVVSSFLAAALSCLPKTDIVPLRREDPEVLRLIDAPPDWEHRTGATEAVLDLWKSLRDSDYDGCLRRLGPVTRRVLRTSNSGRPLDGISLSRLLEGGRVKCLKSLEALRLMTEPLIRERGSFDPTKGEAEVLVVDRSSRVSLELQATFTEQGWVVELVGRARTRYGDQARKEVPAP